MISQKGFGGSIAMIIEKVLNNNMVISRNKEGKEIILQGKGIGFNRKKGEEIKGHEIERIFTPNDKNEIKRFQDFFSKLPEEYWEIAEQMTAYAKESCELLVSDRVLLPICDHLAGAVERYRRGLVLKNPMLWEMKHIYPKEYKVGAYGLDLVKRRFHIRMEADEAAFLAFHYICAQLGDGKVEDLESITRLIGEIRAIVEASYQFRLDEESWEYQRFITHLKFFAGRLLGGIQNNWADDEWFPLIKEKYPHAYRCIVKIADFIHDAYHYELNREEMLYLMIHIEKVTRQ